MATSLPAAKAPTAVMNARLLLVGSSVPCVVTARILVTPELLSYRSTLLYSLLRVKERGENRSPFSRCCWRNPKPRHRPDPEAARGGRVRFIGWYPKSSVRQGPGRQQRGTGAQRRQSVLRLYPAREHHPDPGTRRPPARGRAYRADLQLRRRPGRAGDPARRRDPH